MSEARIARGAVCEDSRDVEEKCGKIRKIQSASMLDER